MKILVLGIEFRASGCLIKVWLTTAQIIAVELKHSQLGIILYIGNGQDRAL